MVASILRSTRAPNRGIPAIPAISALNNPAFSAFPAITTAVYFPIRRPADASFSFSVQM